MGFLLQLRRNAVERAEVPGTVGLKGVVAEASAARGVVQGGTRLVAQGASFRGAGHASSTPRWRPACSGMLRVKQGSKLITRALHPCGKHYASVSYLPLSPAVGDVDKVPVTFEGGPRSPTAHGGRSIRTVGGASWPAAKRLQPLILPSNPTFGRLFFDLGFELAEVDGLGVAGEFLLGHPPVLGEGGHRA